MVLATCRAFFVVARRSRFRVFRAFFAEPYPALNAGGCLASLKTPLLFFLVFLLLRLPAFCLVMTPDGSLYEVGIFNKCILRS
jgi:hypothetical protein